MWVGCFAARAAGRYRVLRSRYLARSRHFLTLSWVTSVTGFERAAILSNLLVDSCLNGCVLMCVAHHSRVDGSQVGLFVL